MSKQTGQVARNGMTVLITHAHTDTHMTQDTHTHTLTFIQYIDIYMCIFFLSFFFFISAQALMWPAVFMQSAKAPLILLSKFGQFTAGFTAAELTQTLFSLKLVCFYSLSSFYRCQQLPVSVQSVLGFSWLGFMFL